MDTATELDVGSGGDLVRARPDGPDLRDVGAAEALSEENEEDTESAEEERPEAKLEMHFSEDGSGQPVCKADVPGSQVTRSIREAWELVDCLFCRRVLDKRDTEVAAWLSAQREAWLLAQKSEAGPEE